jgi:hypothetical protein
LKNNANFYQITLIKTEIDKFNQLHDTFASHSHHSINELNSHMIKLEQHTKNISSSFDRATGLAIQEVEKRLDQANTSISHKSISLIQSLIARAEELEGSTEKVRSTLETQINRMNQAFQFRTGEIATTLSDGGKNILSLIEETKNRLSHEIEIISTTINNLVDERAGSFIYQLIEEREKLSHLLNTETVEIIQTVNNQGTVLSQHISEIEQTLLARITEIDEKAHEHTANLNQRTLAFETIITNSFNHARESIEIQTQTLDTRASTLRDSININSEMLNEVLANQINTLEERISCIHEVVAQNHTSLSETMSRHISLFQKIIQSNDESLQQIFLTHLTNFEDQTSKLTNTFNLDQKSILKSLDSSITKSHMELEEVLSKHTLQKSSHAVELQKSLENILSILDTKLEHQEKTFEKHSLELHNVAEHTRASLEESFLQQKTLLDQGKNMQESVQISIENVHTVLEDQALSLSKKLNEAILEASQSVNDEVTQAETRISTARTRLADSISSLAENIDQKFSENSLSLQNSISQVKTQLDTSLTNMGSHLITVASSLNEKAQTVETLISEASVKISSSMVSAADNADRIFDKRSSVLQEKILKIENVISNSLHSMNGRISQITQETAEPIIQKINILHSLKEKLEESTTTTDKVIGTLSHKFDEQLKKTTQAVEEGFRIGSEAFISNISDRTQEVVSIIQSVKLEIEGDLSKLLQQLDTSNNSLQISVHTLSDNLLEFQQNIGTMVSSSNELNNGLQHFVDLSQNTLTNITQFAEKFDTHANILAEAKTIIDKSDHMLTEKLDNQQESLNALAKGLIKKSDEITNIMQQYEQIITSVISASEKRTLSSTTQIQSDISLLIHTATQQFEKATEEIRKASQAIREEVSHKIDQHSKEVLPLKTKEYADAMRKAVAEQIRVLKELSDILKTSKHLLNPTQIITQDSSKTNPPSLDSSQKSKTEKTLHSLSYDIVEAIDENALIQLWTNYQSGKPNIIPEQLYTVKGQQTFEKIKSKYIIDRNFRQTVRQYIIDFERLLREISNKNTNHNAVQQYLLSETGKVYIMLAHVSGHIK